METEGEVMQQAITAYYQNEHHNWMAAMLCGGASPG